MVGFTTYEQTGVITQEFVTDFNNLAAKIYRHWSLRVSLEDFQGFCMEKTLLRIPEFDPKRSNLGNYLYNIILNEARRIYSGESHDSDQEIENVCLYKEASYDEDKTLFQQIYNFASYAYKMGVYINQEQLLAQYQTGQLTPAVKAFCWLLSRGRL